jgi:hypothetical protein
MILKDFPGLWKILQDHGSTAGGAWRARSEGLPRTGSQLPSPTFHGDGGANRDKSQRKMTRQREKWHQESPGRREWLAIMGVGHWGMARQIRNGRHSPAVHDPEEFSGHTPEKSS